MIFSTGTFDKMIWTADTDLDLEYGSISCKKNNYMLKKPRFEIGNIGWFYSACHD